MNDTTSIDSLLDSTLDDLADMPEFKIFPAGAHQVIFDWESKTVNNKPVIEFKFTAIETVELADATKDTPLKAGDSSNMSLFLVNNDGSKNEFSEGTLKMVTASLANSFGGSTVRETLDAAKNAEVLIVTGVRENKKTPGTFNMTLNKLEVM